MSLFGLNLLNAPLFWGLFALVGVPTVIHLLNRRRFQRIDWAPMKYLKLTIKTNRRRLRIEQLILLAIRTLAVLFLVAAVGRPLVSGSGLGAWLGGKSRTSRVLVIDDSLSMGYAQDNRAAFDTAKSVLGELVRRAGAQDSVTAFATSAADAPLVREGHLDGEPKDKLLADLAKLPLSDAPSNWGATFKAVDDALASATFPVREVVIVTDFRRSGWGGDVTAIANKWAGQTTNVRLIDVGSRATANVALLALEQEDPIALPNTPVNLKAVIRNDLPTAVTGAQAVLAIGDQSRPVVLPELPPGQTTEVPLTVTLQKPGQYPLHLRLPDDAMNGDNGRWLNVDVRPKLDITLVDGEPSAQPFESASDFLALSFSVGSDPWHVARLTDSEWAAGRPVASDVLVLAQVGSIAPQQVDAVERLVRNGMGLMIFCGEQVDANLYDQRLFRDGQGLLPAKLGPAIDGPVTGLVVEPIAASPLAALNRIAPAALARIKTRRFMSAELPKGQSDECRVLARWNDADGHPAVIEKRFGKGRVILWTTSANKQWGDWPIDPTYVLAVRSSAMTIARGEVAQDNLTAGQPIQLPLEDGSTATEAKLSAPGREGTEAAVIDRPEGSAAKGITTLRASHTARAGTYALAWKDATGREQSRLFCVNGDKAESDLTPIADRELANLLGNLRANIVHYSATDSVLAGAGKEIWRAMAWTLLALLAVETVFAVWVGRER